MIEVITPPGAEVMVRGIEGRVATCHSGTSALPAGLPRSSGREASHLRPNYQTSSPSQIKPVIATTVGTRKSIPPRGSARGTITRAVRWRKAVASASFPESALAVSSRCSRSPTA
jgi:hypothetical protein